MENTQSVQKRRFQGVVVSNKSAKTIHVLVNIEIMNKKYNKAVLRSRKYPVHDEKQVASIGDKINFEECRPLSKTKRWRLIEVIK